MPPTSATQHPQSRWKPVEVSHTVSITGGYNKRSEYAPSIQYTMDGTTHMFLQLDKNTPWFLKGVGGTGTLKGDLKNVNVMEVVRKRYGSLGFTTKGDVELGEGQISAVAGTHSDSQDPDSQDPQSREQQPVDPMDAMDDVSPADVTPIKKPRKRGDLIRTLVHAIDVPTRPTCAGGDEHDTTVVWVYRKPSAGTNGKANLYLRADCIDWLLSYGADELAFQGVDAEAVASPVSGNCPAVADLYLEWNFTAKSWDGKFVAGPFEGTTKFMAVTDLDHDMWAFLRQKSLVQKCLRRAGLISRKNAAKEMLTMWFSAMARNDTDEFNAVDALMMTPPAASSPPQGTKRHLEDDHHTAVAAEEVCLADGGAAFADSCTDDEDDMMG